MHESYFTEKIYKANKIWLFGPNDKKLYYYKLSSIAVDYTKCFKKMSNDGSGWYKIPKNPTNVKMKIIGLLSSMRKLDHTSKYVLNQTSFMYLLERYWGPNNSEAVMNYHDKLHIFGIITSQSSNYELFVKLAQGVKERNHIDDPKFGIMGIFSKAWLDFNSEDVVIQLPDTAAYIEGGDELDPNDSTRIRITRGCDYRIN